MIVWTCDYPGCEVGSEKHEGWERWELLSVEEACVFAIPIIGSIAYLIRALVCAAMKDFRHYCPEHAKFLRGEYN